jgi:hypothetical protein
MQERLQRTAMSPQCLSKSESDSKIAACAAGAIDESCRKTAAYFMELMRELGNRIDRSIEKWHVYLLDLFWQLQFTRAFVRESCERQLILSQGNWAPQSLEIECLLCKHTGLFVAFDPSCSGAIHYFEGLEGYCYYYPGQLCLFVLTECPEWRLKNREKTGPMTRRPPWT